MTAVELKEILAHRVQTGEISLVEVQRTLLVFKDAGGSRDQAEQVMKDVADFFSGNEMKQDRVLEILDIVKGWCNPSYRVWD